MDPLFLQRAPALDANWDQYEQEQAVLSESKPTYASPLQSQPVYAKESRALTARMIKAGACNYPLAQGIVEREFVVPASQDNFPTPVFCWELLNETATVAPFGPQGKTMTLHIRLQAGRKAVVSQYTMSFANALRLREETATIYPTFPTHLPIVPSFVTRPQGRSHPLNNHITTVNYMGHYALAGLYQGLAGGVDSLWVNWNPFENRGGKFGKH